MRARRWRIICLLLAGGFVATLLSRLSAPSLLRRAVRLPETTGWLRRPGSYGWLSGHQVLHLGNGAFPPSPAFVHDLNTGKDEILLRWTVHPFLVSPDGKWLIEEMLTMADTPYTFKVTDLARKRARYVHERTDGWVGHVSLAWLSDNSGWVELGPIRGRNHLVFYSLQSPKDVRRQRVDWHLGDEILGVTRDGHVVVGPRPWEGLGVPSTTHLRYSILDIGPNHKLSRDLHVRKPIGAREMEWALSPDGTRVAWTFQFRTMPPGYDVLGGLYRALGLGYRVETALWLSRLDGSDMREIGRVDTKPREIVPDVIEWTPDGKRISFLFRDSLWTVPVD